MTLGEKCVILFWDKYPLPCGLPLYEVTMMMCWDSPSILVHENVILLSARAMIF